MCDCNNSEDTNDYYAEYLQQVEEISSLRARLGILEVKYDELVSAIWKHKNAKLPLSSSCKNKADSFDLELYKTLEE